MEIVKNVKIGDFFFDKESDQHFEEVKFSYNVEEVKLVSEALNLDRKDIICIALKKNLQAAFDKVMQEETERLKLTHVLDEKQGIWIIKDLANAS